jgi:hypothetical protein
MFGTMPSLSSYGTPPSTGRVLYPMLRRTYNRNSVKSGRHHNLIITSALQSQHFESCFKRQLTYQPVLYFFKFSCPNCFSRVPVTLQVHVCNNNNIIIHALLCVATQYRRFFSTREKHYCIVTQQEIHRYNTISTNPVQMYGNHPCMRRWSIIQYLLHIVHVSIHVHDPKVLSNFQPVLSCMHAWKRSAMEPPWGRGYT